MTEGPDRHDDHPQTPQSVEAAPGAGMRRATRMLGRLVGLGVALLDGALLVLIEWPGDDSGWAAHVLLGTPGRVVLGCITVGLTVLVARGNPMVRIGRTPFGVSPATGLVAVALVLLWGVAVV